LTPDTGRRFLGGSTPPPTAAALFSNQFKPISTDDIQVSIEKSTTAEGRPSVAGPVHLVATGKHESWPMTTE